MWNLCAPMCRRKRASLIPRRLSSPALRCFSKEETSKKVSVNVVPDISGLRLNFILEPAYYLGTVDFKKSQKRSLYPPAASCEYAGRRSLRPGARSSGGSSLGAISSSQRYFRAQVHTQSHIDDSNQLVNITFTVQMGRQARIGTVELKGPADYEQTWLLHKLAPCAPG